MNRQPGDSRKRRASWAALAIGSLVILAVPVLAHHSFGAYYFEDETIDVEGEVVEFQYRNPHSWIFILADQPFSAPKPYAAEWASTSRLERDEITRNTIHPGDRVRIWASPSRAPGDNRIRLKRIERPADHWRWGQNPRETR
jgi:hypothetical protein